MKNVKIFNFYIAIVGALQFFPAVAQEEHQKVTFDFVKMTLFSIGTHSSAQEEKKSGITAELQARKNALENLTTYFKQSCEGLSRNHLGPKPDWEKSFHSQGSEIFSNNVIQVFLAAPLRQVMKTPFRKKHIKTAEGKKIAFSMLFTAPASAVRCGAVELQLENDKKILLVPSEVVSSALGLQVVKVVFDKKALFQLASAEDRAILQNSTLFTEHDKTPVSRVVPIVLVIPESTK
jgi:hypothetical protein